MQAPESLSTDSNPKSSELVDLAPFYRQPDDRCRFEHHDRQNLRQRLQTDFQQHDALASASELVFPGFLKVMGESLVLLTDRTKRAKTTCWIPSPLKIGEELDPARITDERKGTKNHQPVSMKRHSSRR